MIRWLTIAAALLGLIVAVYAVTTSHQATPEIPLARPASVNPFAKGVAALGLVEPAGRDVAVVAPEAGLVTKVHKDVGERVGKGDPLFALDTRVLEADLLRARAQVVRAQAAIDRWKALPRKEDLPALEASVARARAQLADREDLLRVTEAAAAKNANNARDVAIARFSRDGAQADLDRALADLASARAGGWEPDLVIAEADLAGASAQVRAIELLIDRLTVRAPQEGMVLRRDIEEGEFATTTPGAPAMILGDLAKLRVRAQVDEEDIGLIAGREGARVRAMARTRGAVQRELALSLVRIEPFARPKTDLVGVNTERVDTRVIDVVFDVLLESETNAIPLFPGQAVDVFVDADAQAGVSGER